MIRSMALWAAAVAVLLLSIVLLEEKRAALGKTPLGRLRRFWMKPEKRGSDRYRVSWLVRYHRVETNPSTPVEIETRDVSRVGAGLTIAEKLPVGSFLRLEIHLPSQPSPLQINAEVVWLKELTRSSEPREPRRFFIGVRFTPIPSNLQQEIARALGAL